MTEVLYLSLRELSDSNQPSSRGNLIPERLSNLRCCKGQFATIVVQQVPA